MKASVRNALIGIIAVILIGGYAGYNFYMQSQQGEMFGDVGSQEVKEDESFTVTNGTVSYTVFDVGVGSAILAKSKSVEALIDTGTEESADNLLKALKGKIDGELEYLVLTSSSKNRLGGLEKICAEYDVGTCVVGEMGDMEKYVWKSLSTEGEVVNGADLSYDIGEGATLFIIKPSVSSDDPLDRCLVTNFTFGETGFVSLSDAGKEEISRAFGNIYTANVIVPSRNGDATINKVVPDLSYKYVAVPNVKGSGPAEGSLDEMLRGKIYVTGVLGELEFTSDGKEVYATDEKAKDDVLTGIRNEKREAEAKAEREALEKERKEEKEEGEGEASSEESEAERSMPIS